MQVDFPDSKNLMTQARQRSGLSDFGDPAFQANLDALLDHAGREADLEARAVDNLLNLIRQRLASRLQVEEWYRNHPELNNATIGQTVSITGLPRTGTTALTNILSLDDQFRPLRSWEQLTPCPPPVLAEEADDPRRQAALTTLTRLLREQPEFAAMHLSDVDATEEDFELLGLSFAAQQLTLPCFNYHVWWRDADLRPAFAYHRRITTLLQSRRPPNDWLFKAPAHSFHLDALFAAYPNTRVIITHRDPAKAVPSTISLLAKMWPPGRKFSPEAFGRHHYEHQLIGVQRAMAARQRIGEDKFLDIHHRDFVADPFRSLDRIYAFLGRELRPAVRSRMAAWHSENRSGAHGSHHYTAEEFGLTASRIRSDFDFYIKRFDVS